MNFIDKFNRAGNKYAYVLFTMTVWFWTVELHQPWLWFITGGNLVKRWFLPAAARARGQSNDLNREILASNLFNCCKEVINAPPVPSISRCIHIFYQHKNVWEYQWSNFIYNCMSTFLHYVHCKDALLDCSAPGGERCKSLTRVDEILEKRTHWNLGILLHKILVEILIYSPKLAPNFKGVIARNKFGLLKINFACNIIMIYISYCTQLPIVINRLILDEWKISCLSRTTLWWKGAHTNKM